MFESIKSIFTVLSIVCVMLIAGASFADAQTTAFTYQGRLTDNSIPPTGSYDFQFKVYTAATGGAQQGFTVTKTAVPVTNGVFTVQIDMSNSPFVLGDNRYLEISVRLNGSGAGYTTLTPRQQITSAPYAVQSIGATFAVNAQNADALGSVAASQFVQTGDARLSNARTPTAGSSDYIQNNSTTTAQTGGFNVSGNSRVGGTLTTSNAAVTNDLSVQGNVAAQGVFTGNGSGITALNGSNITSGVINAFSIPNLDASKITTGTIDARLSSNVPLKNTANTFTGIQSAGIFNATTQFNLYSSRFLSSPVAGSTFVGINAGNTGTTGTNNTFIGNIAGNATTTGTDNTFVGNSAGSTNTTGSNNTLLGAGATLGTSNLNYATAIGAGAAVSSSNSIEIGRTSDKVTIRGNGRVVGNLTVDDFARFNDVAVFNGGVSFFDYIALSASALPGGGSGSLCLLNTVNPPYSALAFCSSSIRYKKDVENFSSGLDLVKRLRPVTFTWKSNNQRDLGFVAEEVNAVEPLMTTYNEKGEVEGVKYDRISAALVNAVNEQQDEIKQQKEIIERQQKQIAALVKLMCASNPAAEVCKQENK